MLRDKLETLRRQSGSRPADSSPATDAATTTSAPGAPKGAALADLKARIERLRTRDDARARQSRGDEGALAVALGGDVLAPGVIRVDLAVPLGTRHGTTHLTGHDLTGALAGHGAVSGEEVGHPVFLDTETTGLSGGTGTVVFLVGLAWIGGGSVHVRQLLLTRFAGEGAMLEAAAEALRGARPLVSFNGRTFDAPLLATRYRLAGLPDPLVSLAHLDLLAPTRRAFRGRWPDCRLATAERELLGFTRLHDLPGSEAPEAWFSWVRGGRAGALPGVLEHNRWDVISLVALATLLHDVQRDPLAHDANVACVRASGEGDEGLFGYLLAHRARLAVEERLELARLARRRRDWVLAVEMWEPLAARDHPEALERLAKYLEHVARDPGAALPLAERLVAREPDCEAHRHRERRLRGKLDRRAVRTARR